METKEELISTLNKVDNLREQLKETNRRYEKNNNLFNNLYKFDNIKGDISICVTNYTRDHPTYIELPDAVRAQIYDYINHNRDKIQEAIEADFLRKQQELCDIVKVAEKDV